MDTQSEGPVCPVAGDGHPHRKGKKKSSRNTEFYVPCGEGNEPRFVKLSEHKKPNKKYQPNRASQRQRAAEVPRFVYLSEPKKQTARYNENRSSPEWHLKSATLKARPSSRISELAKPKQFHKDWQGDRPSHIMPVQ
ncbi:sperm microtubule associated protein 2 [Rhinoraja longicauda]